jgi:hypothetical protein
MTSRMRDLEWVGVVDFWADVLVLQIYTCGRSPPDGGWSASIFIVIC